MSVCLCAMCARESRAHTGRKSLLDPSALEWQAAVSQPPNEVPELNSSTFHKSSTWSQPLSHPSSPWDLPSLMVLQILFSEMVLLELQSTAVLWLFVCVWLVGWVVLLFLICPFSKILNQSNRFQPIFFNCNDWLEKEKGVRWREREKGGDVEDSSGSKGTWLCDFFICNVFVCFN